MRHRKRKKILGRATSDRNLLRRNLAISLISSERIKTTVTKAKWLRSYIEKLISLSKKNNLTARRRLMKKLNNNQAVNKLLHDINQRFDKRPGGYTRVVKVGQRLGDGAQLAIMELVVKGQPVAKPQAKKGKGSAPTKLKDKKDDHEK